MHTERPFGKSVGSPLSGGEAPSAPRHPGSASTLQAASERPETALPLPTLAALQPGGTFGSLMARIDERLNPILVKDLRSWMRSRRFLVIFFVVLALGQLAIWITVLVVDEDTSVGRQFFVVLLSGVGMVMVGGIPWMTQDSFIRELKNHATELALIARLSPADLVRGKVSSGLAASLLCLAAVSPADVPAPAPCSPAGPRGSPRLPS